MIKQAILCTGWIAFCLGSSILMAKDITLYDQPSDTAKAVGKIDTEAGFVPIFTQKDGKWAKVGNPDNGNTGWVKSSDLADAAGSPNGFSYSQSMVSGGTGAPKMVVRFGKPKPMSEKQLQDYLWKSRQQQQAIQRDIQNMMQNFFNTQPDWIGYPMVLPVMVVPVQRDTPSGALAAPEKASSTVKQKS